MPDIKLISGSVIILTDADMPTEGDAAFQLTVSSDEAKRIGASTIIEVAVSKEKMETIDSIVIFLPTIKSLGGFLEYPVYLIDPLKRASPDKRFSLNCPKVEEESEVQDFIMGLDVVSIEQGGGSIMCKPVSSTMWWGSFGVNSQNFKPEGANGVIAELIEGKS